MTTSMARTAAAMTTADMATEFPQRLQAVQRLQQRRARGLGLWPALWLVLCLLLAQHAGLTHRIHHGGLSGQPLQALLGGSTAEAAGTAPAAWFADDPAAGDDTGTADSSGSFPAGTQVAADPAPSLRLAGHICLLFDGATVAASHCGTPVMPALSHHQSPVPSSVGWRRPDLQHPQPFRSRAPPAALAPIVA